VTESKPWGLVISVALMAFVGYHAYLAHKDPMPYMIKLAESIRAARMRATQTPAGRKLLMKVSTSSIGAQVLKIEHRYLGLGSSSAGDKAERGLHLSPVTESCAPQLSSSCKVASAAFKKKKKGKSERRAALDDEEEEQEEPLVGQPQIEGFDDDIDGAEADDNSDDEADELQLSSIPSPKARNAEKPGRGKTELLIKVGGATKRREIDLRRVADMGDLQRVVASVCKSLGADMSSGGLRMQYTNSDGETITVSRSTTIDSIRAAKTLLLLPKETAGTRKTGDGRGQTSRGKSARASSDMDME